MAIDWQLAANVAQVSATVLTGLGIIVSIWIGIRTLHELRIERIHSVRPWVMFDRGAQLVQCRLTDGNGIPGVNIAVARKLRASPGDNKSWRAEGQWEGLVNHGTGSAINVSVTFLVQEVEKGGESFVITSDKLHSFPYTPTLNQIPASPSHLTPGSGAAFFRIPTPNSS